MDGALIVVPAGSLDGEIEILPTAHICFSSRAGWEDLTDNIRQFEGLPT